MNTFTIRDIENLSGIKAHTLRIWEQRYGIIVPQRKESKHRLYGTEDLKMILRISNLYHSGYKISRIAAMSREEISRHAMEGKAKGNVESVINQLMEASIDLHEESFRDTLDQMIRSSGVERTMVQIVYPFLVKLGKLWLTDHLIPAQEHFASSLIRNILFLSVDKLPARSGNTGQRTVILCPPGEFHEIPLLFIQYLFRKNKKSCVSFGCDTQTEVIEAYINQHEVNAILVHLITNFTFQKPEDYLLSLLTMFPGVRIIASGPVFHDIQIVHPELSVLRSLDDMLEFCNQ